MEKEQRQKIGEGESVIGFAVDGFLEACVKPGALGLRGKDRDMDWSQVSTSYAEDYTPSLLLRHHFGRLWHRFTRLFVAFSGDLQPGSLLQSALVKPAIRYSVPELTSIRSLNQKCALITGARRPC